jgi:hypothetical protein
MSFDWILTVAFYRVAEKCTLPELLHGIVVDGAHFKLAQDKLACFEQFLVISRTACAEVTQSL